jgi:inhibitor of KinA sporulation pathway (predicted exonuclease)
MSRDAMADEILVVDLESTCWEKNPPPGQTSDIIEIGVAHLNRADLKITKNWNVLVIPKRSTISEFCTKLNGVTEEDIKISGVSLEVGFENLIASYSLQRTWASYGNYDRKKMEDDARTLGFRYPMSPRHINVKTLFAVLMDLPKEVGMAEALKLMDIPLVGRHHSGKDDASNIAKILARCIHDFRIEQGKHIMPDGSVRYAL